MLTQSENLNCVLSMSQEHKAFLWTQAKTASSLATKVFENFGFQSYRIINNLPDFSNSVRGHHHTPCLFNGHENYIFISTLRNPYQQVFSEFLKRGKETIEDFRIHLEKKYQKTIINNEEFLTYTERLPDYTLKVENLYQDYMKIPFINKSNLAYSGELKKIIDLKINEGRVKLNWKNFYDQNIADMVYYNSSCYFDLFGYDKNSWKI